MNTSNLILITDVNAIIHLEKAGLIDILVNDKRVCIVDLVLYDEYEYKKDLISNKVRKIKTISLNDKQISEATELNIKDKRNSFYDYCSYIAARDNDCILLSGDFKLKRRINYDKFHGVIWYVQDLYNRGLINKERLNIIYSIWINDPLVFIDKKILNDLINEQ